MVAATLHSFHIVASFVGAMGGASLAYTLPALFNLRLVPDRPRLSLAMDWAMAVFGILVAIIGTSMTIKAIV